MQPRCSPCEAVHGACGSTVLFEQRVCGFSTRSAEKPHAQKESSGLPKAEHANCVSPNIICATCVIRKQA